MTSVDATGVDLEQELPSGCKVEAWRPPVAGISEVFHARIVDYGYPTHCHDTWTVLIVDTGAITYDLDTKACGASGATVAILPPGVTHNGQPASGAPGFTKRVLYLDNSFLPLSLVGAAVDQTNIIDPTLRHTLVDLHAELANDPDPLHAESSLTLIAERITWHLGATDKEQARAEDDIARRLRQLLDAAIEEPITLSDAAQKLERSKPHLIRSFTAAYGVAPHAYLIGRRVEAARKLLLNGIAPAEAATAVGFYDQSHLTRHFKRHTSVPPATYASSHASQTRS